jgi:sec-independent protein translocase protein TatA
MPNLKGWEIVIILALLLLLFGAKRLPDAARGLGRSMRIFKAETKGLRDDDDNANSATTPDTTPAAPRELEGTTQPREPATPQPSEHEARER